jgi:WSC domain
LDGWTSLGCWSDSVGSRTLASSHINSDTTSDDSCQAYCASVGYNYAGTEYGGECYCANTVNPDATQEPDTDCNMACQGQPTQPCGGPGRINLFWNGVSAAEPTLAVAPGIGNYEYTGCFTDSVYARALSVRQNIADLTPAKCMTACASNGYKFAGVEYSSECYCGNEIDNLQGFASDGEAQCNMPCSGDSSLKCGGPARVNIYTDPTAWSSSGCYTDGQGARTLTHLAEVPEFREQLIPSRCIAACNSMGYSLAGVEFGQECWCDNAVSNGGYDAGDGCTKPCTGDATKTCGGPDRIEIYSAVSASPERAS